MHERDRLALGQNFLAGIGCTAWVITFCIGGSLVLYSMDPVIEGDPVSFPLGWPTWIGGIAILGTCLLAWSSLDVLFKSQA